MNISASLLAMGFVACTAAAAGDHPPSVVLRDGAPPVVLSGNARIDFTALHGFPAIFQEGTPDALQDQRKSPWLAGGLSVVLPGAGEFYSGSYLKTAAFLAVEAALWIFAYKYDQKGNRQTDFFQNFANAHWSVVNYATYAVQNYAPGGLANYPGLFMAGSKPWMQVNWAVLNRMESDIAQTTPGMYYSHNLPAYNTQQYYELIGKYPQFNQGWDDVQGKAFTYGDQLSAESLWYMGQRGQANTYYTTASTFVAIALVNHVVSAVDAALTAGSYNRGLHASVGSQAVPSYGGLVAVPVFRLAWGM